MPFASEVSRQTLEYLSLTPIVMIILQTIYTASAFELPKGPTSALVSASSASIALPSGFAGAVRNFSTEITVDGVCVSWEPITMRLLMRTSIELA